MRKASRQGSRPSGATLFSCGAWQHVRGAREKTLHRGGDRGIDLGEGLADNDHRVDRCIDARAVEQHAADAAQHAGGGGEPSAGVERRRHQHGAGKIDAAVGRPQAVDTAQRGGHADRAAGVAAERKVAGARAGGRGRSARRAAGNPSGCAQIGGRAVMHVDAGDAEEQLVADRLADDGRAGSQDFCNRRRVGFRRPMGREPGRIARAGRKAGDVVHVLDRGVEPGERAVAASRDRRCDVVRNEERAACRLVHRSRPAFEGTARHSTNRHGCPQQKSTAGWPCFF